MAEKTRDKLEVLQLQRWVRAVEQGNRPTTKDPATQEIIELRLPMAKSDGDGLTFTLSAAGTATWILRYRYGGRPKELTIGNYPDIGLAAARKIAREKRSEIDRGGDPASDKRKATLLTYQDWTVRSLIVDYRVKVLVGLGQSTQRSYGRSLLRIEARLGAMTVSKITPMDIVSLIEQVGATWTESNMLLCTAKMLFRHAAGKKLIAVNPCTGIELNALLGKRPPIRRRLMLSQSELHVLMNAKMKPQNVLAIKVLLGTAVRSDELIKATRSQIDFENDVWSIPSSKTGPGMQVPITAPVKSWFQQLILLNADSEFILPTRAEARRARFGGDAPIDPNTIGSAIKYWIEEHKPEVRSFTPHDLRSTAKSQMRALGVPSDITEMCLNHKLRGVEGIYDVHTYFDERKDALTKWGDFLVRCQNLA
ncbi:integrase [Collimonas sp. PA-H2]|uniref:tyrosine-type recombinase/integrase n=1 Tax=Collimonas sp. PA-H2 TaxID=1881062 RepID=UPI000C0194F6|nr:site-specific integrase [Collimonas sp. PA-H2]PFH10914.1 integrase [Collimonas sp. PA-H2]